MIHLMWKRSIDPDNSAIPYLTALGDLLGGGLLALAFEILFLISDKEPNIGDWNSYLLTRVFIVIEVFCYIT